MMRGVYQLAASACAELVWRVPELERPFVGCGPHVWGAPGIGRFYRSAAFRLADRLRLARGAFRPVRIAGRQLVFDVSAFTVTSPYFGGPPYEPETTAYLAAHVREGQTIVDVGANHGYFTVLAASLVGATGRVFAFEPNPVVRALLTAHVERNGFSARVTIDPRALGAAPAAAARLFVSQDPVNTGLSSLTPNAEALTSGALSERQTVDVPVDTLDRWCDRAGVDRIDLLKIDVEGAEASVLDGMAGSLLAGRIATIIVETPWQGPVHARLAAAGYEARPLDAVGDLTNILFTRRTGAIR